MAGDGMTAGRQRSRASSGSAPVGGLRVARVWTTEGVHPYDEVEWERRDVVMTNWRDGSINFEQRGVEFPAEWSINATNIVTTKYFRGAVGTPQRETSLLQLTRLVQRRHRLAAAGQRLLHPGRRRHDGLDPELVPGRGPDLQGRLGRR